MGAEFGAEPSQERASQSGKLLAELMDAVRLARIAPGQRMSLRTFAALGRATDRQLDEVLPELAASGLVTVADGHVTARPLDRNAMLSALPRRIELETKIVRAAAVGASGSEIQALQECQAQQQRCAILGDIDGLIQGERELERLLAKAAGLHDEALELTVIKQEFRRAWCAANRLRTFTNVADIRNALVAAVAARDPDAAEAQVKVFFAHLIRTY
jgi:DNA-binding GntR family transcriptional regulator